LILHYNIDKNGTLQQQKRQKTNDKERSDFDTSCDGNSDSDRVHKKVVKRLWAALNVSFATILPSTLTYLWQ